jgi:hypothetical protein
VVMSSKEMTVRLIEVVVASALSRAVWRRRLVAGRAAVKTSKDSQYSTCN